MVVLHEFYPAIEEDLLGLIAMSSQGLARIFVYCYKNKSPKPNPRIKAW